MPGTTARSGEGCGDRVPEWQGRRDREGVSGGCADLGVNLLAFSTCYRQRGPLPGCGGLRSLRCHIMGSAPVIGTRGQCRGHPEARWRPCLPPTWGLPCVWDFSSSPSLTEPLSDYNSRTVQQRVAEPHKRPAWWPTLNLNRGRLSPHSLRLSRPLPLAAEPAMKLVLEEMWGTGKRRRVEAAGRGRPPQTRPRAQ